MCRAYRQYQCCEPNLKALKLKVKLLCSFLHFQKSRLTSIWISGSEYIPSCGLPASDVLEEGEESRLRQVVDSSGIDPNEVNEAQRFLIHQDEVNFIKRMANLNEWAEVFTA